MTVTGLCPRDTGHLSEFTNVSYSAFKIRPLKAPGDMRTNITTPKKTLSPHPQEPGGGGGDPRGKRVSWAEFCSATLLLCPRY